MKNLLNPEKALIFRITHVHNVAWILENGLHCLNGRKSDPNYIQIGNSDLIARRTMRKVPIAPGGTLSDYIPFYFTPFSPMLLNIKTGYNGITKRSMDEIAILVASLRELQKQNISFVFADRHAYLQTAQFYGDLDNLDQIDWSGLQSGDFRKDPDNPAKVERYQAEALIYGRLPISALSGIIYHSTQEQRKSERLCATLKLGLKVLYKPRWYL
ncbi:MAG TPA: DUF4433 domain-containing protein [Candidatus Acidoferrum sp.]|nr:DUF4433 domain-containing protein [Candidatus Acidoferrum sp.]